MPGPTTLPDAYTFSALDTADSVDHGSKLHVDDRQEIRRLKSGLLVVGSPVINGGFNLWQRGTSFATVADGTYTADRWRYGKTGAMVHTISRSADAPSVADLVPRSNYSILVDCTTVDSSIAAGDFCIVEQRIEGYNWLSLDQTATAWSFWHKHTKTGTYCVALVNSGGDRSCVATYTQAVADTWELATVTFPASPSVGTWDYTTGIGARLVFTLTAGSTFQTTAGAWQTGLFYATSAQVNACDNTANNFKLWGIQPNRGSEALPFIPTSFDIEQRRCLYYYQEIGGESLFQYFGAGPCQNTTVANIWVPHIHKRVAPTITVSAASDFGVLIAGGIPTCTALSASSNVRDASIFTATVAAGLTAGQSSALVTNNTLNSRIRIDAEL